MLPGRVSNPGPLTYESDALPITIFAMGNIFIVSSCFAGLQNPSKILSILKKVLPLKKQNSSVKN